LRRRRKDNGKPLVGLICVATSHDSTPHRLREENPHAQIVALSDPSCVPCVTADAAGRVRYAGPHESVRDRAGRTDANPDYCLAQAVWDSLAEGGLDMYWRLENGEIACPQAHDAVWHPIGQTISHHGRMMSSLEVWAHHAVRLVKAGIYDSVMADCTPGTWLSYGEPWNRMGLGDLEWRDAWVAAVRGVRMSGVRLGENCYGGGGPRDSDEPGFVKIERPFEQGGLRDDHGWWGYVACVVAYGVFRTGLPLLTQEQAQRSIIQVSPRNKTPEQRWELLRASFALALLFDIGYLTAHELWGNGEFWDPWNSELQSEIELWTRLEPVGQTVWRGWSHGRSFSTQDLPDAAECLVMGDLVGCRDVRDPIGGQRYRVWINPNPHNVGTIPALSVKLV